MTEKYFFEIYISALENALANDSVNHGYLVFGPYWYIDDEKIRNEIDLFEQNNYERYSFIFDLISRYFDARSHYLDKIDGLNIDSYKLRLQKLIDEYKINLAFLPSRN